MSDEVRDRLDLIFRHMLKGDAHLITGNKYPSYFGGNLHKVAGIFDNQKLRTRDAEE